MGVGATETLYAAMQALLDPGDEAVLITPAFDIYAAQVQMAGGVPVSVPLPVSLSVRLEPPPPPPPPPAAAPDEE